MREGTTAGEYDPLARQRSLGDEKRQELRDHALTEHATESEKVRGHIRDAIKEHTPEPFGDYDAMVDFYGRHGHLREELAKPERDRRIAKDKHPDPQQREPLDIYQTAKITMRGEEYMQANGITRESARESGRAERERREVMSVAHPEKQRAMTMVVELAKQGGRGMLTHSQLSRIGNPQAPDWHQVEKVTDFLARQR